ncbi:MAG: P-loop NTPase [Methanomicrobiales archaeon]|nr:P-loop NTPase [Methanomicrobiales archaeon]
MKIAVSGKGGVGKTFIAGTLAWLFAREGKPVIAIDADSSPNLALSLGISPEQAEQILPVSENKELIDLKTATEFPGVYNLSFTVDDIITRYALPTPAGVHLLVMGTVAAMGSGCACPANMVVQALLRHLVVHRGEVVILDMEAGVEHLGRGTADHVDLMLVVTDANGKSLHTARRIAHLSEGSGILRVTILGNRIENAEQQHLVQEFCHRYTLPLLGCVPFDPLVRDAGLRGGSVFPVQDGEALRSLEKIRKKLLADAGDAP